MLLSYLKQGVYGTGCRGAMVTKDQDCIAGKFNRQYSNSGERSARIRGALKEEL